MFKDMEIRIESGERVRDVLPLIAGEGELYLVYDSEVAPWAGEIAGAARAAIAIEASEENKSMDTVLSICRQLMEAGASRKALVLAVGGGITTDLAGFAASIYKRGIRYANLPTTLLAQVDAAVGGKTGVNLDDYKNMLGVIVQPVFTFLTPEVLKTLPERELCSGAAELLKTFLIGDAAAYGEAVRSLREGSDLGKLILRAASIKADIVRRDPFEHGERRVLNLGHSFAHALEHEARLREDDLSHGEAVGIGMLLAARLSERLGLAETGLEACLRADFHSAGLRTDCPYPLECLAAPMAKDKKAADGTVHFILPVRPGEVIIRALTPAEAVRALIA